MIGCVVTVPTPLTTVPDLPETHSPRQLSAGARILIHCPGIGRRHRMSASAHPTHRYALSFTSGALLARESVIPAPLYFDLRDWQVVRDLNDGVKAHYPKSYPALTKITGLEASNG